MIIFNGTELALKREERLAQRISAYNLKNKIIIASVIFKEDKGSCLYTRLKKEAAERVGIVYQTFYFSIRDSKEKIKKQIEVLNQDDKVTGVIIQKPSKNCFLENNSQLSFKIWWKDLIQTLSLKKDVDGLHPETLKAIQEKKLGEKNLVLPATCRAVLTSLETLEFHIEKKVAKLKILILGKTDLLGKPLFYFLKSNDCDVEMIGSKAMYEKVESHNKLFEYDLIISATGRSNLIKAQWLKKNVAVVDVGEPRGDLDIMGIEKKAQFITPVPGGIGPLTVIRDRKSVV